MVGYKQTTPQSHDCSVATTKYYVFVVMLFHFLTTQIIYLLYFIKPFFCLFQDIKALKFTYGNKHGQTWKSL